MATQTTSSDSLRGAKYGPGVTRSLVLDLYRKGYTQQEIAQRLRMSRQAISYHVQKIKAEEAGA